MVTLVPAWGRRLNHLKGRRHFWKNSNFSTRWLRKIFFFQGSIWTLNMTIKSKNKFFFQNPKNTGCPKSAFFRHFDKCPPNPHFLTKTVLTLICSIRMAILTDGIEIFWKKVFLSTIQGVQKIDFCLFFEILHFDHQKRLNRHIIHC